MWSVSLYPHMITASSIETRIFLINMDKNASNQLIHWLIGMYVRYILTFSLSSIIISSFTWFISPIAIINYRMAMPDKLNRFVIRGEIQRLALARYGRRFVNISPGNGHFSCGVDNVIIMRNICVYFITYGFEINFMYCVYLWVTHFDLKSLENLFLCSLAK